MPILTALGAKCTVLDYSKQQCESERLVAEREGYDIGTNFIFDEKEDRIAHKLPYNPLKDKKLYEEGIANHMGVQFSHTLEEQIGGQLKAGFTLTDLYEDTNGSGNLHEHNIPSFVATRAVKL